MERQLAFTVKGRRQGYSPEPVIDDAKLGSEEVLEVGFPSVLNRRVQSGQVKREKRMELTWKYQAAM